MVLLIVAQTAEEQQQSTGGTARQNGTSLSSKTWHKATQ